MIRNISRTSETLLYPSTFLSSLIILGSIKARSAIRWNVYPSYLTLRRQSASLRLSSPSGAYDSYNRKKPFSKRSTESDYIYRRYSRVYTSGFIYDRNDLSLWLVPDITPSFLLASYYYW
ncbi:hypothetical protein N7475_007727 [Penicillium sp. IBT 31633x]|nr:hypothetical protein N7475_007727 [Penicillium sp. IBT 31633x]